MEPKRGIIDDTPESVDVRKTALLAAANSIGRRDRYNGPSYIINAAKRFEDYLKTGQYDD